MRVLALADVRPDIDLVATCASNQVEAVFLLGDLRIDQLPGLADVTVPKIGVYGNHCRGDYLSELDAINAHGRHVHLRRWRVAGLEGCPIYKANGEHQYSSEAVRLILSRLTPVDIMLSHCPPRGVNDHDYDLAHRGWEPLREWVLRTRPRHLLHGHTYPDESALVRRLGTTDVHYVYGSKLIDLV